MFKIKFIEDNDESHIANNFSMKTFLPKVFSSMELLPGVINTII